MMKANPKAKANSIGIRIFILFSQAEGFIFTVASLMQQARHFHKS